MATTSFRAWRRAAAGGAALLFAGCALLAAPVEGPLEAVVFAEGDTIRAVAQRYLKDPDLWPQILELSGIGSPAGLVPGARLLIPVQQVAAADDALAVSLVAIQRATAEGARIFAPVEIKTAIENRDMAVESRGAGAWAEVVTYAGTATDYAGRALEISLAQRDRAAEAIVSDVHGEVEGRAPAEPGWSARSLRDVLVEFERVRTLSESTAQVTFRDLSRLRLNANSNAVIQQMRSDPLTGGEVTKVSLVDGDFYALLNQLGDRSSFEVEVPGIETRTQSADFWIRHDAEASRFANYDAAALEISRGAETISLGENEGAVVPAAGATERGHVLGQTALVTPHDGARLYGGRVELGWQGVEAAEGYWIEVAADRDFNAMKASEWGVRATGREITGLAPGQYFWRVSALDRLGLPGERSLSWRFALATDATPPYLTVLEPREGAILAEPEVTLEGESEPGVRLTVAGRPVPVAENGRFVATVAAAVGANSVTLEAVDAAGNRTERTRSFLHRPAGAIAIAIDPALARDAAGRLVTRADELDVVAVSDAEEGTRVRVLDAGGTVAVQTLAGADGGFRFTVPASEAGAGYTVEIVAPGGGVEGRAAIVALRDAAPPEVRLDAPPPRATAVEWLELTGEAGDAVAVTLNGAPAEVADGRFTAGLVLAPGVNAIEIVATDLAGNVGATRLETALDTEPPAILSAAARRAGGGGPIEIVVEARDASGLRQAAPFLLTVGGAERRGFLRCDGAAGTCRETLPPEPGELRLVEVAVEDYAGNVARHGE
jgi:hypothetical protein